MLGGGATALVAVANAVAEGHITVVPDVLVTGGGGGPVDGLAATLMRYLTDGRGGNGAGARPGAAIAPSGSGDAGVAAQPEPAPEGPERPADLDEPPIKE